MKEAEGKWLPELGPQVGQLAIDGAAGTGVKVDGGDGAGVLPLGAPYAVAPGRHHVEGRQGADLVTRDIDVAGGQTVAVHLVPQAVVVPVVVAPEPTPQPVSPAPSSTEQTTTEASPLRAGMTIGLGVVAVAAIGTGIYFSAAGKSKSNDAQDIRNTLVASGSTCGGVVGGQCAQLKSDLDSQNHDHTAATALYIGGGVFAVGAILSWILLPKTVETHSAIAPMIGPGFAGARWAASF